MRSIIGFQNGLNKNTDNKSLSRKIYLGYPTEIFIDKEEMQFDIFSRIKERFEINYLDIQVCGSSKTGFSLIKEREFIPGQSDLDIAIINQNLYQKFLEKSHEITGGFSDLSSFPTIKGERSDRQFFANLSKGYFNPLAMPQCRKRSNWLDFFRQLSNNYYELFKNINASVYSSEYFFESKQEVCISRYKLNPKKYDQISS